MRRNAIYLTIFLTCVVVGFQRANAAEPLAQACRFQFSDGHRGWSIGESQRTFHCWVNRYGSPDVAYSAYIAERESGWYWHATSSTGCLGIYQWLPSTWVSARASFPKLAAVSSPDAYNARSNIGIAIKFQRRYGFGPWEG